jgi:hypothetical protein
LARFFGAAVKSFRKTEVLLDKPFTKWVDYLLDEGLGSDYSYTHPQPCGQGKGGGPMTLGIGVLCDHGDTIVMGSERRATYGASSVLVGPNDECGKQFYMKPHRIIVSVAGRMSVCHAVYSQLSHLAKNLRDPSNIPAEMMMTLVDEARFRALRRLYDWEIKREMGVTLHQWASGKLPRRQKMDELVVKFGLKILESTSFPCQLILAGFQEPNTFFMRACEKEMLQEETSPGVYAIGGGQTRAVRHLNKRGQNVHMGLPRTLLHVYEALYLSQSEYVGPPPESLVVIFKRDTRIALYLTALLEEWRKAYEARETTASLDDSHIAATEVRNRLRELKPQPYEENY